jgi:KDO2-lipid IV(A) lauroyltransferase
MREARWTLEWIAFLVLGGLAQMLPRRAALFLGTALASFTFDVLRIRRRVAIENIEKHLPLPGARLPGGRREAVRIARRSYAVMARTFVDILQSPKVSNEEMWKLISYDTVERVAGVVRNANGAVLVSAHFGNWELLIQSFSRIFPRVRVIVGDQSNRRVDAAVKRIREKGGVPAMSSKTGIRDAMRFLREGGAIATLMDQSARKHGIFVDFLGAPASTHIGMLALAIRAGVPFLGVLLVDHDGGSYQIEVSAPWAARDGASEEESLREGAVHYNQFLEEHVRRHPDNYFWAHRRWKKSPS